MKQQALKKISSDIFSTKYLSTPRKAGALNNSSVYLGLEVEVENWDGSVPVKWEAHDDDSLRNGGKEFTTSPICGQDVVEAVHSLYDLYTKRGWVSSVRTGIHIHVNMSDRDAEFLLKFISVFMVFERTLFRYAGLWRKYCNFCYPVYEAPEQIRVLMEVLELYSEGKKKSANVDVISSKYTALNLNPLITSDHHKRYGSVEVRILPTVGSAEELIDWINAILAIYNVADKYPTLDDLRADAKSLGWSVWAERELGLASAAFRPFLKDLDIRRGIREANYIESFHRDISQIPEIPKGLLQQAPADGEVQVSDNNPFNSLRAMEKFLQQCTLDELLAYAGEAVNGQSGSDKTVFAQTFPQLYGNIKKLASLMGVI